MTQSDKVTVTQAEYDKMQRELGKLYALEAGGVDNWEWFDESLKEWRKENEFNEMIDTLTDEFFSVVDELSVDAEVDYPAGRECGHNVHIPHNPEEAKRFIDLVIEKYEELQTNDQ